MPGKHALTVSLTEHLCTFIDEQIASGRFGTASEVIRAGLRLLEQETGKHQSATTNGQVPPIARGDATKKSLRRSGKRDAMTSSPDFPIFGVGASAGGVEAPEGFFFRGTPDEPGLGFVIVTHLSPERETLLHEIVGRYTQLTACSGEWKAG